MTIKNIFETPVGDKLSDDFAEAVCALGAKSGKSIKSVLMIATSKNDASVTFTGCTCIGCRNRLFEAVLSLLGSSAGVQGRAQPSDDETTVH